jgi:S1-C subfamily serine protease
MHNFSHISPTIVMVGRLSSGGVNILGTAFSLNATGYLATAAHVIGENDKNLVIAFKPMTSINSYQDTSDQSLMTVNVEVVAVDPFRDLAVLKAPSDVRSNVEVGGADDISVGENISIFGFPHANFGRTVLTRHDTEVGAKVLIASGPIKSKHLILNTQARPGQSGSPIFRRDNGKIVAMLVGSYAPSSAPTVMMAGVDPHTLHQTTHAISTEYLKKMY